MGAPSWMVRTLAVVRIGCCSAAGDENLPKAGAVPLLPASAAASVADRLSGGANAAGPATAAWAAGLAVGDCAGAAGSVGLLATHGRTSTSCSACRQLQQAEPHDSPPWWGWATAAPEVRSGHVQMMSPTHHVCTSPDAAEAGESGTARKLLSQRGWGARRRAGQWRAAGASQGACSGRVTWWVPELRMPPGPPSPLCREVLAPPWRPALRREPSPAAAPPPAHRNALSGRICLLSANTTAQRQFLQKTLVRLWVLGKALPTPSQTAVSDAFNAGCQAHVDLKAPSLPETSHSPQERLRQATDTQTRQGQPISRPTDAFRTWTPDCTSPCCMQRLVVRDPHVGAG